MNQTKRNILAILILVGLAAILLALEAWRGSMASKSLAISLNPGDVPVYQDGQLMAAFNAEELNNLQLVSFVDAEEGKTQDGWLLSDILGKYLQTQFWDNSMQIVISSSSRDKSITLTWGEVKNPENMVMFDLSGRGTLKLVSLLEQLDVRDEWIQDVDKIEVIEP
jgi:hypothetical protein